MENESQIIEAYKKLRAKNQKEGMMQKARSGNIVTRPPFGYDLIQGKLIPSQNYREVEDIFSEFLNSNLSLRKISMNHNLSVNGLKKILSNFTYIGKIKFDGEIHQGSHQPLVSTTIFNHVQNKLKLVLKSKNNDSKE
ncbi:hypothetical protein COU57_02330 [Candidatus Pacearchaeota archaeon CG10_big_fil_rev_8_21_14_0_10_32_14]|nr:MAG: hypothetical protein COU57_02330 [Candidatus Pacearchaeota archaeon CG10_big_fil_rev_8_21_14_0_10_32_14]